MESTRTEYLGLSILCFEAVQDGFLGSKGNVTDRWIGIWGDTAAIMGFSERDRGSSLSSIMFLLE